MSLPATINLLNRLKNNPAWPRSRNRVEDSTNPGYLLTPLTSASDHRPPDAHCSLGPVLTAKLISPILGDCILREGMEKLSLRPPGTRPRTGGSPSLPGLPPSQGPPQAPRTRPAHAVRSAPTWPASFALQPRGCTLPAPRRAGGTLRSGIRARGRQHLCSRPDPGADGPGRGDVDPARAGSGPGRGGGRGEALPLGAQGPPVTPPAPPPDRKARLLRGHPLRA